MKTKLFTTTLVVCIICMALGLRFFDLPVGQATPMLSAVTEAKVTRLAAGVTAHVSEESLPIDLPAAEETYSVRLENILIMADGQDRNSALLDLFRLWMAKEPLLAMKVIAGREDVSTQALLYSLAVAMWFSVDAHRFEYWLAQHIPDDRLDAALENLFRQVSTPEHFSLRFVGKISDPNRETLLVDYLLQRWLVKDAHELISWSAYEKSNHTLLPQIFALLTRQSEADAIAKLAYLSAVDQPYVESVIEKIVINFGPESIDYETYLEIQRLPKNGVREKILVALFPAIANSVPESEIAELVSDLPGSEYKSSLTKQLSSRWASLNPADAAQFAGDLADEADRSKAIDIVVRAWLKVDPDSASGWLSGVGGNIDSAAATMAFYGAVNRDEVIIGQNWVSRIDDPQERNRVLVGVAGHIYRDDPSGMLNYIVANSVLTEREIASVKSRINDEIFE